MDYANGKIYILKNYINDYFYIGSSCSPLVKRLYEHKRDLRKICKSNTYEKMKELNIEPHDLYIELIEMCPCDNVYQLRKQEGKTISEMKDKYGDFCLNKNISGRSLKEYCMEYRVKNREVIIQKNREYRKANSDILNQKVGCIVCKTMVCLQKFKLHCKSKKHQKNL